MESNEPLEHPLTLNLARRITPLAEDICDSNRPGLCVEERHIIKMDKR
jgi:hypothetical protein